jgi:hypothetical protein
MAKIFYIGDDADLNEKENDLKEIPKNVTKTWLDAVTRTLEVSATVEHRVTDSIVKVMDFAGSAQYLATGDQDVFWLKQLAYKVERRGTVVFYYVKRNE